MSWIYVIAVIVFAIVSNVNKANKNKNKNGPRGGMPPFGTGGDEGPPRRQRAGQSESGSAGEPRRSGFPGPAPSSRPETRMDDRRESDRFPAFPEPALSSYPDYDSGEGTSLEHPEEADGVEVRQERMRQELDRVHRALDRISDDMGGGGVTESDYGASGSSSANSSSSGVGGNLRSGLIWAEILGPPRSRRPLNSRRPGGW